MSIAANKGVLLATDVSVKRTKCFLLSLFLEYEMNFHGLKSGNTVDEPYDYRSVMHVPNNYLGKDRKRPIVMKLMPGGPIIGQRQGLSELDARKLNKFYACKIDNSKYASLLRLNPLRSNTDQRQISLCNVYAFSVREAMRIKDMITQHDFRWLIKKFFPSLS